jgi:NADH dehydrogenase FAD-containing subunit
MKIVIIGGGFCGAWVAKKLEQNRTLEVVLIDTKEYFEYSPSLWKLLVNPNFYKRLIIPHTSYLKNTRVVTDPLVSVTPTTVHTKKEKIPFDYLVIATGIDYPIFLKNTRDVLTIKSGQEVMKYTDQVAKAHTILIIGGGLIGVEVAGELATHTPEKHIILVHSFGRLLERNTPAVSVYAQKFLEEKGVEFIFNEKIVDHKKGTFLTNTDRSIKADVGIWCAGIKCNPWFMKDFPASILTEKKSLKVNHCLQLKGYPQIFIGGDINDIDEEKTAAAADRQAIFITASILRMTAGKKPYRYKPIILPMDISLGRYNGIIILPPFMIPGVIAALVKKLVEKIALLRLS